MTPKIHQIDMQIPYVGTICTMLNFCLMQITFVNSLSPDYGGPYLDSNLLTLW